LLLLFMPTSSGCELLNIAVLEFFRAYLCPPHKIIFLLSFF
jgi:hypothetical protein